MNGFSRGSTSVQGRVRFATVRSVGVATLLLVVGLAVGAGPAAAGGTPTGFTSISPVTGPSSGGTVFTITGTGFTSSTTVTIGGVAATVTSESAGTSITGSTPPGTPGAQDVVVSDPTNGTATGTGAFTYSTVDLSAPTVVAGSSLTVSGVTVPGATVVASFDHVSATVTANASTGDYAATLTPLKATSAGYLYSQVVVEANGDVISVATDVVTVTQALTGASQSVGSGTGTCSNTSYCLDQSLAPSTAYDVITLIGSGLTNYNSVNNSDFVGSVGAGNPTLASLTGPYVTLSNASGVQFAAVWVWAGQHGAQWILYSVSGGNTIGSPQTSVINGTYVATPYNDPAITGAASITFDSTGTSVGFSPMVGPNTGGTAFVISIAGSVAVSGVAIGGTPVATFTSTVSATSPVITSVSGVTAPATAGLDSVVITYTGGSFTLPNVFTYVGFSAITPSTGATWAPQLVTITGGGFTGSTGATIGGNLISSFQVVSDTEITGVTPTGAVGPANVVIFTPFGNLVGVGAYTYIAVPLNTGGSSLIAQAPLVITSTSGTAGTSLTLTTSGGSGTGAVSYVLSSAGSANCTLAGGVLSASTAGTCTVTATKAADATYQATSSPATTITFVAPPKPPVVRPHVRALRVNGFAMVGRTVTVTITGVGFYAQPTITSNEPGTRVGVLHDNGRTLVIRVSVAANAATGWHTLTITLANGAFCRVNYLVK